MKKEARTEVFYERRKPFSLFLLPPESFPSRERRETDERRTTNDERTNHGGAAPAYQP